MAKWDTIDKMSDNEVKRKATFWLVATIAFWVIMLVSWVAYVLVSTARPVIVSAVWVEIFKILMILQFVPFVVLAMNCAVYRNTLDFRRNYRIKIPSS